MPVGLPFGSNGDPCNETRARFSPTTVGPSASSGLLTIAHSSADSKLHQRRRRCSAVGADEPGTLLVGDRRLRWSALGWWVASSVTLRFNGLPSGWPVADDRGEP